MRVAIACFTLMVLVGCGRPADPVFQAERIADNKAQELAGNTIRQFRQTTGCGILASRESACRALQETGGRNKMVFNVSW